jgi:hypothetical protein
MKTWNFGLLALLSLALCLVSPVLFFLGKISERTYRLAFLLTSIAWFVFAILWAAAARRSKKSHKEGKDAG